MRPVALALLLLAGCGPLEEELPEPAPDLMDELETPIAATGCPETEEVCSGTGEVYSSLYRVGRSDTASSDVAQTFVVPVRGVPEVLRLKLRLLRPLASGAAPTLRARVVEAPDGVVSLSATDVSTGEVYVAPLSRGMPAEVSITLTGTTALEPGRTYAFILTIAGPYDGAALVGVASHKSSSYPNGTAAMRWTEGRGFSTAPGDYDVSFALGVSAIATAGQAAFTVPGTRSWTVPAGVYSISLVVVGGGGGGGGGAAATAYNYGGGAGGGGGGLTYVNDVAVTPGETLTVIVGSGGARGTAGGTGRAPSGTAGGASKVLRGTTVLGQANGGAGGGGGGSCGGCGGPSASGGGGGVGLGGTGGGTGGNSRGGDRDGQGSGGGGAGGYSGAGGGGGYMSDYTGMPGYPGSGGGGGGGGTATSGLSAVGGSGGGVGIFGRGSNGAGGTAGSSGSPGGGGSGASGALYGGGGGGGSERAGGGNGAQGAARIIWPGDTRFFPATGTANQ